MSNFESKCIEFNVKMRVDGCFCGLLVRRHFAKRFVAETNRKTMEIRHKAVKFLQSGERILLISSQKGEDREFLAILEFDYCLEVPDDKFPTYFPDHQVTEKEFTEYKASLKHEQMSLFGYQFRLVHTFHNPPILPSKLGEVWLYVAPKAVKEPKPGLEVHTLSSTIATNVSSLPGESSIKRKGTISSDDMSMPQLKKQKSMKSEYENQEDSEDEAESSTEEHEESTVVCVLLQDYEWASVLKGGEGILRPFHTKNQQLTVLHRAPQGHVLKGTMTVIGCESVMIGCPSVSEIWEEVYGKRRLAAIKACKSVWIWKIGRTTCAKDEAVQFLDVAPRYRNRTFVLQKHQLFSVGVPGPAKQNFYETGKFLANRMSSELGQLLWQTVSRMKEKNVCLRIGTTCSGTDVRIPALRDLLAYFNDHLKAGGLS